MAKKQKPLKRTPLKRTPLKRKEYNPEDFKNKEYKPLKRTPLKQTPLKPKEYNPEDYKNADGSKKEYKPKTYKKKEYKKKEYKKKEYKKKEYKVKDYRELKAREPKPFVQLTPKEAFLKLAKYCAYQERCYKEIYAKLEEWKIDESDHYAIVTLLEEEKFLNEKRFTESYTRGKFGYKKWGRIKIRYGLLQKEISESMIKDAFLSEIDNEEYFATLTELLEKKWSELEEKESDSFKKTVKATNYALQKGYENELIRKILDKISSEQN